MDQLPRKTNQPYRATSNVEQVLRRAKVGSRFEDSFSVEEGKATHVWPSDRLALAGCKLQASVKLQMIRDGLPVFPKTPQESWAQELGSRLVGKVQLQLGAKSGLTTLVEANGADFESKALQFHPSQSCPDVTYSIVWTLPISAPVPLFAGQTLEVACEMAPFEQWELIDATVLPLYEVIEPRDRAVTRLERLMVHRQASSSNNLCVPLSQRLLRIEFGERNNANASTPFSNVTIWTQRERGEVLLSLSDRVVPDGRVELNGLDCSGCELRISFDSNDHVKEADYAEAGDRAAMLARFGLSDEAAASRAKTFSLRLTAEQDLMTSADLIAWQ